MKNRIRWLLVLLLPLLMAGQVPASEEMSLQAIMQKLGQDMNRLNEAIFADDYAAMERSAAAIADHPRPPAEERARILGKLGEDAPRFRAADHNVHEAARALGDAASQQEMLQVLQFYHQLMQGCVACHTEFRPRLSQPGDSR